MTRLTDAGVHQGTIGEIRQEVDGFTRVIAFEPGYNDPRRGPHAFGRHGMQIRYLLIGPLGATQFLLYTNWVPGTINHGSIESGSTMAADLGYHWSTPQWEDGQPSCECEYLPGGTCYYDGSGLQAEKAFGVLVNDGIDALWTLLREDYDYYATKAAES